MTTPLKTVEEIQADLSAIVELADSENRDLTDDEVAEYEASETLLAEANARRERTDALRARHQQYKAPATKPLFVAAKPDETLEAAFVHYLRSGKENADLQELRAAQSEGTPSEGGFLVPDGFRLRLIERMKAFGGLANVVEEVETETGNNLPWPTVDDTANTGEVVDEGGTFVGGADLVIGSNDLGAYSYMAGGAGGQPLRLSRELVQDAAVDVVALVTRKLGERLARIQSTHLVTGNGVKQPKGIVHGVTGIETAANNALTYADLLHFVHSVDPAYRMGARWAFNDSSLEEIRGILDLNGRPILKSTSDGAEGAPGGETLLGFPVTIDQAFPNFVNNSQTVNWGVFGKLDEGYVVRRVRSVELLVNPYSRMANRQIEYSAWARMDATIQNPYAYVALTGFVA